MNLEQQHHALDNLKVVKDIFDRRKIHYWLDAGTLLCAYRDGDLAYEHDIDIGVFIEDFPKVKAAEPELRQKLGEIGMFGYVEHNFILSSWNNKVHGDILYWYPFGEYMYCHGTYLPFSMPVHFFRDFTTISFRKLDPETQFTVPSKMEEYLRYYFGDGWSVPLIGAQHGKNMKDIENRIKPPYPVNEFRPEIIQFKEHIRTGAFDSRGLWGKARQFTIHQRPETVIKEPVPISVKPQEVSKVVKCRPSFFPNRKFIDSTFEHKKEVLYGTGSKH